MSRRSKHVDTPRVGRPGRSRASVGLGELLRLSIVTQRELAQLTGVERERVASWVNGDELPTSHERALLACHFGLASAWWDVAPCVSTQTTTQTSANTEQKDEP